MKVISTFPFIFLFIYAPFLRFSGVTFHLPYFVILFLSAFGILSVLKDKNLIFPVSVLLEFFLILIFYATIVSYLKQSFDRDFYYSVFSGDRSRR